jgi:hypothetical protein
MGISLMAYIPDNHIIGGIEHIMESQSKFHRPEVGSQVPPGLGHGTYDLVPDLLGQLIELFD